MMHDRLKHLGWQERLRVLGALDRRRPPLLRIPFGAGVVVFLATLLLAAVVGAALESLGLLGSRLDSAFVLLAAVAGGALGAATGAGLRRRLVRRELERCAAAGLCPWCGEPAGEPGAGQCPSCERPLPSRSASGRTEM